MGWSIEAVVDGLPRAGGRRRGLWLRWSLVRAVVRFDSRTLVFNAAREIEYELRNDLFAHLQRLPQSFYSGWRTGDIMSRCVNDMTRCACCSAWACSPCCRRRSSTPR